MIKLGSVYSLFPIKGGREPLLDAMFTYSQTTMGAQLRPGVLRSPHGQSVSASDEVVTRLG